MIKTDQTFKNVIFFLSVTMKHAHRVCHMTNAVGTAQGATNQLNVAYLKGFHSSDDLTRLPNSICFAPHFMNGSVSTYST